MKNELNKKIILGRKKKKVGLLRESWDYVVESKKFIWAVLFVFLAGSIMGFAYSDNLNVLDGFIEELIKKTEGLNAGELTWFILNNNLSSSFFGLILGVFLGIFSIFNALLNGIVVGYVYSKAASVGGYGIIWQLLPHGIFELPAIFISLGLGVKLGMFVFEKDKKKAFIERLRKSFFVFLTIVLPLLVIAAIIEGLLISLT